MFRCGLLLLFALQLHAEMSAPMVLWPDGTPGALGHDNQDIPKLTPYLPEPAIASGAAILVCPGGGYNVIEQREGRDYALWFNQHGIAAFVLEYRLGSAGYRHPAMLNDAARAMRTIRVNAAKWKIDPRRIGIIGSSAGGHVASSLLTHFTAGDSAATDPTERESSRPDLGILCYAVITTGPFAHRGSIRNLLGRDPAPELLELVSNEKHVMADTPPCFVWHTFEDKVVPMENSLLFAEALRREGVPFDLHIYVEGRHGVGLGDTAPFAHPHPWTNDCLFWLKTRGFVP